MNPLIAGWLAAVRLSVLATGRQPWRPPSLLSGIMVPLAAGMSPTHLALLVLAIGAGSVFFSHLNDVPASGRSRNIFGMSVGQTLKDLVADGNYPAVGFHWLRDAAFAGAF